MDWGCVHGNHPVLVETHFSPCLHSPVLQGGFLHWDSDQVLFHPKALQCLLPGVLLTRT